MLQIRQSSVHSLLTLAALLLTGCQSEIRSMSTGNTANGGSAGTSLAVFPSNSIVPAGQTVSLIVFNPGAVSFTVTKQGEGSYTQAGNQILFTAGSTIGGTSLLTVSGPTVSAIASIQVQASGGPLINTLAISPSSKSMMVGNSFTFLPQGGVAPYAWSIFSGGGSIISGTGAMSAPAISGATQIKLTDALGNTAFETIPITSTLALSPTTKTLLINGTATFSASGGVGPYTYSVIGAGCGTVGSTTGVFIAPGSANSSCAVQATDAPGNTVSAAINILASSTLALSPRSIAVMSGATQTLTASGGVTPYTYSVTAGTGTIDPTSGIYTASATATTATIQVMDSSNFAVTSTVKVSNIASISNLKGWYAADQITGYTDGSPINLWTDLTLNHFDLGQSNVGNYPLYKTNVLNGKPAIRLQASANANLNLSGAALGLSNSVSGISAFVVASGNSSACTSTAANLLYIATNSGNAQRFQMSKSQNCGASRQLIARRLDSDSNATLNAVAPVAGVPYIEEAIVDYANQKATYFVNGAVSATSNSFLSAGNTGATDSGYIAVDSKGVMNLDISEILIFNKALSPAERDSVETYLADKYGLYHPNALWPTDPAYTSALQTLIASAKMTKEQADVYKNIGLTVFPDYHLDVTQVKAVENGNLSYNESTFPDQSGNGLDLRVSGNGSASKKYVQNAINGKSSLRFDTSGAFPLPRMPSTLTNTTALFVVTRAAAFSSGCMISMQSFNSNNCHTLQFDSTANQVTVSRGVSGSLSTQTIAANVNNFNLVSYVQTGPTGVTRLNAASSQAPYSSAMPTTINSVNNSDIAGSGYCGCSAPAGDVAEIISYPYSLNASQVSAVETYLRNKYGI